MNAQMNVMADTVKALKPKLTKLQRVLEDLSENLEELQDMVDDMGEVGSSRRSRTLVMAVNSGLEDYSAAAADVSADIAAIGERGRGSWNC